MRKLYIVGLIAVALLVIGLPRSKSSISERGIAIADEITFSTYYPAPAGRYREFSTTGRTTLATNEWGIETDEFARVGIGTTGPVAKLETAIEDSGTNTVVYPLSVSHYSTGTSEAGFGSGINFRTETWNPAGVHTDFGRIRAYYNTFNTAKMTFSTVYGHDTFVDAMTLFNGNVGIGTADPTQILHLQKLTDSVRMYNDVYSSNNTAHRAQIAMRRSHQNTVGLTATTDGDFLGTLLWYGVNSSPGWSNIAAQINVKQNGAAGAAYIPADMIFRTSTDTGYNLNQLVLHNTGNVGIGTTDPETKATGSGYLDAQDVYLRDANDGAGAWASEGGGGFGSWTNKDSLGSTLAINNIYQAGSDGFVLAWHSRVDSNMRVFTDSSPSPDTERIRSSSSAIVSHTSQATVPVKSGHYVKITTQLGNSINMYWLPLGSGSLDKQ